MCYVPFLYCILCLFLDTVPSSDVIRSKSWNELIKHVIRYTGQLTRCSESWKLKYSQVRVRTGHSLGEVFVQQWTGIGWLTLLKYWHQIHTCKITYAVICFGIRYVAMPLMISVMKRICLIHFIPMFVFSHDF